MAPLPLPSPRLSPALILQNTENDAKQCKSIVRLISSTGESGAWPAGTGLNTIMEVLIVTKYFTPNIDIWALFDSKNT